MSFKYKILHFRYKLNLDEESINKFEIKAQVLNQISHLNSHKDILMENITNTPKIHIGSRTFLLPEEMTHLDADSNYTVVNLSDGSKIISSTTLSIIERRLIEYKNFFRVNKSIIVNLNYARFEENCIVLNDNRIVFFSRRKGKIFKENYKIFSN